jgi:hypothetical protein
MSVPDAALIIDKGMFKSLLLYFLAKIAGSMADQSRYEVTHNPGPKLQPTGWDESSR